MLKKIPSILPPQLLKILMEMGHADEIVIADGNFPAASIAACTVSKQVIRMDGHDVPPTLEAILQLFPLDHYVEKPVGLMQVVSGDTVQTPIGTNIVKSSKPVMKAKSLLISNSSNGLNSMKERRRPTPSSPRVKKLYMQISF